MSDTGYESIFGEVLKVTEKALFVLFETGDTIWVPRSVVEEGEAIAAPSEFLPDEDRVVELQVARWFAQRENLI